MAKSLPRHDLWLGSKDDNRVWHTRCCVVKQLEQAQAESHTPNHVNSWSTVTVGHKRVPGTIFPVGGSGYERQTTFCQTLPENLLAYSSLAASWIWRNNAHFNPLPTLSKKDPLSTSLNQENAQEHLQDTLSSNKHKTLNNLISWILKRRCVNPAATF